MTCSLVREGTHWVMAIDPGGVTGWAMIDMHGDLTPHCGEESGRYNMARFFREAVGKGAQLEVVCEDFIISERTIRTSPDPNALRLIGWLDLECERLGIPFTLQAPGVAKSFSKDDMLKRVGWWNPSPGGHQNDALRHLLRYMVQHHKIEATEILQGGTPDD